MLTACGRTTTTLPGERKCGAYFITASDRLARSSSASEAKSKYSSIAGSPFMHLPGKENGRVHEQRVYRNPFQRAQCSPRARIRADDPNPIPPAVTSFRLVRGETYSMASAG